MRNIFNTLDKRDKIIFFVEIWLILTIAFVWALLVCNNIHPTQVYDSECYWYTHFGYYCPGCGGTRAFEYMLYGHFLKSFFYHPFVMYTISVIFLSFVSYITYFISRGNIMFFKIGIKHLILADFVIIFFFLIRNFLVLYFGVYIY